MIHCSRTSAIAKASTPLLPPAGNVTVGSGDKLSDFTYISNLIDALLAVVGLILLITRLRVHPFIALILAAGFLGLSSGMPVGQIMKAFQDGFGGVLGFVGIVLGLGTMLGKLMAESGGADRIARTLIDAFGRERVHWAMMCAAFLVGIPLFFEIGFVLLAGCQKVWGFEDFEEGAGQAGGGIVVIPPGRYLLPGERPITLHSRTRVRAEGASFHFPESLGEGSRRVSGDALDVVGDARERVGGEGFLVDVGEQLGEPAGQPGRLAVWRHGAAGGGRRAHLRELSVRRGRAGAAPADR